MSRFIHMALLVLKRCYLYQPEKLKKAFPTNISPRTLKKTACVLTHQYLSPVFDILFCITPPCILSYKNGIRNPFSVASRLSGCPSE